MSRGNGHGLPVGHERRRDARLVVRCLRGRRLQAIGPRAAINARRPVTLLGPPDRHDEFLQCAYQYISYVAYSKTYHDLTLNAHHIRSDVGSTAMRCFVTRVLT